MSEIMLEILRSGGGGVVICGGGFAKRGGVRTNPPGYGPEYIIFECKKM